MIYLDTHVVVWLYAGLVDKFTPSAKNLINDHDLFISPAVRLELQYLYEIERITDEPHRILEDLSKRIGLKLCDKAFDATISQATLYSWTRNPFDRLIVANAALNDNILLTQDRAILANYAYARW